MTAEVDAARAGEPAQELSKCAVTVQLLDALRAHGDVCAAPR